MTGVYIGSTTSRAGKSLFAFSLGVLLQKRGCSVGYMKPVGHSTQRKDELYGDADALVAQEVLGQNAPADQLTPVLLPENIHALAMLDRSAHESALPRIQKAYHNISAERQVTLVSGVGSFPATGRFANVDGLGITRALGLKTILVERFNSRVNYDLLLLFKDLLGPSLLGVVLNDVPDDQMRDMKTVFAPWLESQGIPVLGVVGHEPGLASLRIIDLALGLRGRLITGTSNSNKMVRGFLIGTMQVDNFMMHLRQSPGSAIIVGGDRADLQLAALHAKSPCIVLTGNIAPSELIRSRAESMGVTLVAVREDTYTVARSMARILRSKKVRDLQQIRLGISLMEKSLDLNRLFEQLAPDITAAHSLYSASANTSSPI